MPFVNWLATAGLLLWILHEVVLRHHDSAETASWKGGQPDQGSTLLLIGAYIVSTVVAIIATGFFVGGWMKMYPIDTAIVTACHSGQGGTGDVAILTAGNRMQLMPFAQIATRIGGAITVTSVLILLTQIG